MTKPIGLTIAGSDSGGGAGIQADIKAMEANGVFATTALTAITAQNTQGVNLAFDLPLDLIEAQIDAVLDDMQVSAFKTGMLSSTAIIELVARKVEEREMQPIVVDPVMVATSGDPLLKNDAVESIITKLIPMATLVTPNAHEASHLTGYSVSTISQAEEAAKAIHKMGAAGVLVKGGHLSGKGEAIDVFYDGETMHHFNAPFIDTPHTHGTGCTYASAIAAHLAHGLPMDEAISKAKIYVTRAIRHGWAAGKGHGPTNHFPDLGF